MGVEQSFSELGEEDNTHVKRVKPANKVCHLGGACWENTRERAAETPQGRSQMSA